AVKSRPRLRRSHDDFTATDSCRASAGLPTPAKPASAMGIPFVVAYVVILNLTSDSPDDGSSDATIMSYYGSHSHRVRDITAFFVVLAGGALFLWFLGHLRGLLSSAEGAGARG